MGPDEKLVYARTFSVHVGVDTGKKHHVLVARGPSGVAAAPLEGALEARPRHLHGDGIRHTTSTGAARQRRLLVDGAEGRSTLTISWPVSRRKLA